MMRRALLTFAALATLGLAGCDLLGIEGAAVVAERKAAEGQAIGAACRHAGRAIEDCYALNKKADKAAVYAGWREMDDYMRENKLEPVPPQLQADARAVKAHAEDESDDETDGDHGDAKADKAGKAKKAEKGGEADKADAQHARAAGKKADAH